MIPLSTDRAKTLLALHGWPAVILGLFLYAVILTGTTSVLAPEIADWSSPLETRHSGPETERAGTLGSTELPPGLDGALRRLATQTDPQFHEEVSAFAAAGGRIRAFFHKHEVNPASGELEERGVEFDLDPRTFAILDRREGWEEEIGRGRSAGALADFLTQIHVRLHVPEPYGLILTGILGLALMLATVTGFVIYRNLLRDLFTLRGTKDSALAKRDLHSVAGAWILPFAFILAFTGSFFSFAGGFGIPALAQVAFEGDDERLVEQLLGAPRIEDVRPTPIANLDAMIADAGRRAEAMPSFLVIEHWGHADAQVTLFTEHKDGELTNPNFVYAGSSGELRYAKPIVGMVPSVGGSLTEIVSPLHFGDFAGWTSRLLWLALGLTAAYVSLTGLLLWCARRREARAWQRLARVTYWVGYGLPMALAATPYGYFWAVAANATEVGGSMAFAFIGTAISAAALVWFISDLQKLRRLMLGLTGLALLGLPAVRLLSGGPGWTEAWVDQRTVVIMDMLLALGGAVCLFNALRAKLEDRAKRTEHSRAPLPIATANEVE